MSTPRAAQPKHRFTGLPAVMLALTVVLVLVLAVLFGGQLYAEHKAKSLVADAVQCEAEDSATVQFDDTPPVLAQYLRGDYPHISVQTAGNQIRKAKGMQLDLDIRDIHVEKTADSKGTIGSLDGTITWPAEGIKQSIEDVVPVIGSIVTGKVTTDPGAGTVELKGLLNRATVKPKIVDNGLKLELVDLEVLGQDLDSDTVQRNLDDLTKKVTGDLPLGIHIDSSQVTDSGVVVKFSTQNATIPASSSSQCFASL